MAPEYDFIVVGSGPGGGPLACNLALAPEGFRVALLEAGPDPCALPASRPYYNYTVPAFHTGASEDPQFSWAYSVNHYDDAKRQGTDSKVMKDGGVLYPRAGAVGGCTAIHAMVTVTPNQDDWTRLAALTGDPSWGPANMRQYFERLEECDYLPRPDAGQLRDPATRHGFAGWLPLTVPDPALAFNDKQMLTILVKSFLIASVASFAPDALPVLMDAQLRVKAENQAQAKQVLLAAVNQLLDKARAAAARSADPVKQALSGVIAEVERLEVSVPAGGDVLALFADLPSLIELFRMVHVWLDPNRWFERDADRVGAFATPASILYGARSAVRERILDVRALYPDRLELISNALATEVIIEGGRAAGVRYVQGEHLYRASPLADAKAALPPTRELRLRPRGEVILSCGAFNTPQLLMLSGVGSAAALDAQKIKVKCELPGVGANLQDRYEVAVVSELPQDFTALDGGKFEAPEDGGADDPALQQWLNHRGIYTTNGITLSILLPSRQAVGGVPDLCLFGIPGYFRGYYPGYSRDTQSVVEDSKRVPRHRRFTWVVLKAKTVNRAGGVRLRSPDPRDSPSVGFRYFDEGSAGWEKDLAALVEGVGLAAQIMKATGLPLKTLVPDVDVSDAKALADFVRREAWGHHACGTCKIGNDAASVLDRDFRVRGVENLRVVDASVFPEIPGYFIVAPIYMISEKASDVILAGRRAARAGAWPQPVRG